MRKRVPYFFWDFHWKNDKIYSIKVESDEPQYPVLAEFILHGEYSDNEIELAEKMIDDLESGRLTLKKAFADYEKSKEIIK